MPAERVLPGGLSECEILRSLNMLHLIIQYGDKAAGYTECLAGQPDELSQHIVTTFVVTAQRVQGSRAAIVAAAETHKHGFLRTGWLRREIKQKN
jgi:hypothetical protein